jgi:hypothetical protein
MRRIAKRREDNQKGRYSGEQDSKMVKVIREPTGLSDMKTMQTTP